MINETPKNYSFELSDKDGNVIHSFTIEVAGRVLESIRDLEHRLGEVIIRGTAKDGLEDHRGKYVYLKITNYKEPTNQKEFSQFLEEAPERVKRLPEWKRNVLE